MDSQREGLIEELERLTKQCEEQGQNAAATVLCALWAALVTGCERELSQFVLPFILVKAAQEARDVEEAQP